MPTKIPFMTSSLYQISTISQALTPTRPKQEMIHDSGYSEGIDHSFLWQRFGSSAEESIAVGGQPCFNKDDFNNLTLDLTPRAKLRKRLEPMSPIHDF